MRMYDLIQKKRDGVALSAEELRWMIHQYSIGNVPDYQMSAFTMAVFFRGMSEEETAVLTDAMANSGDRIDLSRFGNRSVDKHSTGGVGDKTTLILAPIVASLGGYVAKISGRGLGHTGGTVDKLEAIPGFRTAVSEAAFLEQVASIGVAVIAPSANLAPADKKLYALRDVTATVDAPSLIASSIMSKKLAAGASSIVLDVKCGSGSFCKTLHSAQTLAQAMIRIGVRNGRHMTAIITDMDLPLGYAIGNAIEVQEAIAVLRGEGPKDLQTLCIRLATEMTALCCAVSMETAEQAVRNTLANGNAYAKFCEWIQAQGGDIRAVEDVSRLPGAKHSIDISSPADAYIEHMKTEQIGITSVLVGAGRSKKEDQIDPGAGILLHRKTGDYVHRGERIATLYSNREDLLAPAATEFSAALRFSANKPKQRPLILDILRADAVK